MKFDIAVADKQAAAEDRQYTLTRFDLPSKDGSGTDFFLAVRPVAGAFLMMLNVANRAQQKVEDQVVAVLQFLDVCFVEEDLRAGMLQAAEKDPKTWDFVLPLDSDVLQDEDLSDAGVELMRSNKRLYGRLMDRSDDLGPGTLAEVMKGLVEEWSGNPITSPSDYLPPQKPTGKRSTGRSSRTASTSSTSTSPRRRGSSRSSASSSAEA